MAANREGLMRVDTRTGSTDTELLTAAAANGGGAPLSWPRKVDLFGVGLSVTDYEEATKVILHAAQRGVAAVVACQSVHAVVTASEDLSLTSQVNSFELVTPDGQPVRWAMNLLHGPRLRSRVYVP